MDIYGSRILMIMKVKHRIYSDIHNPTSMDWLTGNQLIQRKIRKFTVEIFLCHFERTNYILNVEDCCN